MEVTLTNGTIRIVTNADASKHKIHRINKFLLLIHRDVSYNKIKHICEIDESILRINFYDNKIRKLPKIDYKNESHFGFNRIKSCKIKLSLMTQLCGNKIKDTSYCISSRSDNKYLHYI